MTQNQITIWLASFTSIVLGGLVVSTGGALAFIIGSSAVLVGAYCLFRVTEDVVFGEDFDA